jgi:hypothetical protein
MTPNMKLFENVLPGLLGLILITLYFTGLYVVIADDHRYTSKHVILAVALPPYPVWVGGIHFYRMASLSSEMRVNEEQCLEKLETLGAPRKFRLSVCECLAEGNSPQQCEAQLRGS